MKQVTFDTYADKIMPIIKRGAFLTTKVGDKVNTMTIGWGQIGVIWNKNIFTVLVRPSRFTYDLIEQAKEFTVSIPLEDKKFGRALGLCGVESGRVQDKISKCGLTLQDGQVIATPVIAGCGLHYECKVVYKQEMTNPVLEQINSTYYPEGDYHTMYFGEIVTCYID